MNPGDTDPRKPDPSLVDIGNAEGYFSWAARLTVHAAAVVRSYGDELPEPQPDDLRHACEVIDTCNLLEDVWRVIRERGTARPDEVEVVAVLSAALMRTAVRVHEPKPVTGRPARKSGGRKGGRARTQATVETHEEVRKLHAEGRTQKEISEAVGIGVRQVRKILTGK